jgi:hypothetical protein
MRKNMTLPRKVSIRKAPAMADASAEKGASIGNELPTEKPKKRMAPTKSPLSAPETRVPGKLTAIAPESKKSSADMRTRLSKAFSRPLDKKLKKETLIRDSFTFPKVEYAQLSLLKKRLSEQGNAVKKSELIRAGLMLLSVLDDSNLKSILAKVPSLD